MKGADFRFHTLKDKEQDFENEKNDLPEDDRKHVFPNVKSKNTLVTIAIPAAEILSGKKKGAQIFRAELTAMMAKPARRLVCVLSRRGRMVDPCKSGRNPKTLDCCAPWRSPA